MQSTHSLSLLPGPFCPGVVAPDRVLSNRNKMPILCKIELLEIERF